MALQCSIYACVSITETGLDARGRCGGTVLAELIGSKRGTDVANECALSGGGCAEEKRTFACRGGSNEPGFGLVIVLMSCNVALVELKGGMAGVGSKANVSDFELIVQVSLQR